MVAKGLNFFVPGDVGGGGVVSGGVGTDGEIGAMF